MTRLPFALVAPLLIAAAPLPGPFDAAQNARVFDAAFDQVDRNYWDKAKLGPAWQAAHDRFRAQAIGARSERERYAAVNALLDTLGDSHVYAVGPSQVGRERDRDAGTATAGYGFSFWRDGEAWRVLSVQPGSPAARAGVQIGWQLLAVDGEPATSDFRPVLDRESLLRFADENGRRHDVTVRGTLLAPDPERRARRLPGDILLLSLEAFQPGDERWVADALAADGPPAGVILDLRENGGGDADVIARVAGRFFLEKHTLLRRTHRDGFEDVPIAGAGRRAFAGPLAVLVGPRSASGAEAVAAMVEESDRGITLGERTSGALTGASETNLPDGGLLSVAVFDIRTPAGARIEGRGFTPRYVVRPTLADLRAGRDPVVARAATLLAE